MRKPYLDNVRYFVVLSVVFYHLIYLFNSLGIIRNVDIPGIPEMDLFLYILYPWFMVCLFIISGCCARYSLEKQTDRQFLRSKLHHLLLPSIAGIFLLGWTCGWVTNQYTDIFFGGGDLLPGFAKYLILCLNGIGVLWFLHQLVLACLVLLLARKLDKKDNLTALGGRVTMPTLLLLAFALWGTAQVLNTPLIEVYRNGIYIFAYLLGYYVFSQERTEALLKKWWWLFLALAVVLGIAYTFVYWGRNFTTMDRLKSPLTNAYAWFGCLAVLAVGKRFFDRETRFTQYMRRNSFGFYILHYPLMVLLAYALDRWLELPAWGMYLGVGLLTAALLPPVTALVRRIPVVRTLLLGL